MTDETPDKSGEEAIPLDISGHEDRERPDDGGLLGESADNGADDDETDNGEAGDETDDSGAGDEPAGPGETADEDEDEIEPVEVLVQLAEDGEIDPWDIDIVAVTDKFLQRVDEADLRSSGRALFYASVLLRMKSDAMLDDGDDEDGPEPWEQAMTAEGPAPDGEADPFAALEQEMDRRLERKRARGTPQTLDELVRDLREAERDNWWKESREYDTSPKQNGHHQGTQQLDYRSADEFRMDDEPTEAAVTDKTHGEDIETVIEDVHTTIREQYEKGRVEVLFREVADAGGSRVETFLGVLFLSHRGHVRLRQDEIFGDLWIQDPSAVQGSGEAVAD